LSKIIWFTGLSGSGKSTIAEHLKKKLEAKKFKCLLLDGDIFRLKTKQKLFTKNSIKQNNLKIIKFCKSKKDFFDFILVSVISPLRETRTLAKNVFGSNYCEIFVNCSLKELFRRDTKKLYAKAKSGELKNLIGYNSDIKYQKTYYKKIKVNTHKETIAESYNKIIKQLQIKNYL